jgi:hypothetical protein
MQRGRVFDVTGDARSARVKEGDVTEPGLAVAVRAASATASSANELGSDVEWRQLGTTA